MLRLFIRLLFLISMPFILLIRGAIYFHEVYFLAPTICIIAGLCLTTFLIAIYLLFFYGRVTGTVGSFRLKLWMAFLVVGVYSMHGLFFLSTKNVKHSKIQKDFRSIHPILRLSISTIIRFDPTLIITDSNRIPEDYRKMGMKSKKHSLHYKQSSGYVHAIDIRTNNRSFVRNYLIRGYFWMMGFNTLLHGGTGEHLHVSLSSADRPGAI